MKTLVLTLDYASRNSYYYDWKDAFLECKEMDVTVVNLLTRSGRRRVQRHIGEYELIILLHSCTADSLRYVEPLVGTFQARRGRLVCFVGNEYNLPWIPLGDKLAWLDSVKPDIVATQLLPEAGQWLYESLRTRVLSLPHALNAKIFTPGRPTAERQVDIGTRSYRYPAYIGDNYRNCIYDFFIKNQFVPPLVLDFSTKQRFNRKNWAEFLNRCKATISTEAGSWYLERNDVTVSLIRNHVANRTRGIVVHADSPLQMFWHHIPSSIRTIVGPLLKKGGVRHEVISAETLDFDEIYSHFFDGRPRSSFYTKCISSRHFDAIGTKTVQIMFPGRFNDILQPGQHYVSLEPDFSNVDEVLRIVRDSEALQRIADTTYSYAMAEHTYAHRIQKLLRALA